MAIFGDGVSKEITKVKLAKKVELWSDRISDAWFTIIILSDSTLLWWLIFCVSLTGHRVSRLNIISGCVCEISGWNQHLSGGLRKCTEHFLPKWVGIMSSLEGLSRTIGGGRQNSAPFSCLDAWAEPPHLIFCCLWTGIYDISSLGFQAFRLRLKYTTSFPSFRLCDLSVSIIVWSCSS